MKFDMGNTVFWRNSKFINIPTVVGLAMLALGVLSIPFTTSFVSRSELTEGTVVEVERKRVGMDGPLMDFPTVRFVTENGRSIVFTSNMGESDRWQDRKGVSVPVRYDPDEPTNAKIDSIGQLYGLSFTLILLDGVFIFFGIRGANS